MNRHTPLWYKMDPRRLWLLMVGWRAFAQRVAFTIFMVYQVRDAQMDPLQLVLAGTALEIGVLLFEVPTGIVADTYSRRISVIAGYSIIGLGFVIMVVQPAFWAVALGSFVWGIGHTFTSGAAQAWLADEIGEDAASEAYLAGAQLEMYTKAVGIIVSVLIASVSLGLAILVCGLLNLVLAGMLLAVMGEDGYRPVPIQRRQTVGHMIGVFRSGIKTIRTRPLLIALILMTLMFAAQSESYDRLSTAHLLENFTLPGIGEVGDVVWFGVISMASLLIGVFVLRYLRRRVDSTDPVAVARALWAVTATLIALFVVFAVTGSVALAIVAMIVIGPLREAIIPLHLSLLNRGLDPRIRATVISMDGQTDAVGQLVGGPPMGVIGRQFGVQAGLIGGALLLAPGIWLGARITRLARGLPASAEPSTMRDI
ncbi:MAG: MFS transporter [Chloroflexi bacterium]|nr:MFS transporter [Chloroflexota bacterium]